MIQARSSTPTCLWRCGVFSCTQAQTPGIKPRARETDVLPNPRWPPGASGRTHLSPPSWPGHSQLLISDGHIARHLGRVGGFGHRLKSRLACSRGRAVMSGNDWRRVVIHEIAWEKRLDRRHSGGGIHGRLEEPPIEQIGPQQAAVSVVDSGSLAEDVRPSAGCPIWPR